MHEQLDAAADWLQAQPDMRPWQQGRARLVAQIDEWLAAYVPITFGRAMKPTEPLYAECATRLWACWEYHWRQAAEMANGSVDGFEVAGRLQRGLGFKGGGQLGGNPLEDGILALGVSRHEPEAIERFTERFRTSTIRLGVKTNARVAEDEEDFWCRLLMHLTGMGDRPGALAKYASRCGLKNWLMRVARNLAIDWASPSLGSSAPLEHLAASDGPSSDDSECVKLLGGVVRRAIAKLPADQSLLLHMLYVEQLPGKSVAAALGRDPGNVTRQKQRAIQTVQETLAAFDVSSSAARGYRDCLESLTHTRNLRELADVFLATLSNTQLSDADRAKADA